MTTTATALGPPRVAAPDSPGLVAWYAEGFSDRLGDRLLLFDNAGPSLELLRFRDELRAQPGFESALRARVDALVRFRHPRFTRVRSVTHLQDPRPQLALVSELPAGERLSTVLRAVDHAGHRPGPSAALWLLRELLPALTALHESDAGVASGLITPERVFVEPDGRLTLTEYAIGDALSALPWTPARLWARLGIPLRLASHGAAIDPGSDVSQLALVALALLRGRLLAAEEFPVSRASIEKACGAGWPASLAEWLTRALVAGEAGFASAAEALAALDAATPGVMGAWSSALLPHALPPAPETAGALQPGAPAPGLLEAGEFSRVPTPLVRLFGTAISTHRLWRLNAALAVVVCLEAAAILALLVRVGTGTVLVAPVLPAAPQVIGWLQVDAPVEVTVYANGRLLGTGVGGRYGLPAGRHLITLASEERGIRSSQPVEIAGGRTVLVALDQDPAPPPAPTPAP